MHSGVSAIGSSTKTGLGLQDYSSYGFDVFCSIIVTFNALFES